MATQDDINNLTEQIASEQRSTSTLDQQIAAEQQRSAQLISGWRQQADSHRESIKRMQYDLQAKQQQLQREQQQAIRDAADQKAKRDAILRAARHLL